MAKAAKSSGSTAKKSPKKAPALASKAQPKKKAAAPKAATATPKPRKRSEPVGKDLARRAKKLTNAVEAADTQAASSTEVRAASAQANLPLDVALRHSAPTRHESHPPQDLVPTPAATAMSPEEAALAEVYGDEMAPAAVAHREFRDGKTADEDRPMTPELNARDQRKRFWEERRDERQRRRQERHQRRHERNQQQGQPGSGSSVAAPELRDMRPADAVRGDRFERRFDRNERGGRPDGANRPDRNERPDGANRPDRNDRPDRSGGVAKPALPFPAAGVAPAAAQPTAAVPVPATPGVAATLALFASFSHAQPIPVKQLAQMLRKRTLLNIDAENEWGNLKAELLWDERCAKARGLLPRVISRGRDMFGPGPGFACQPAEAAMVAAFAGLAAHVRSTLKQRLLAASATGLERIIATLLLAQGYRDVVWVKRVDGICYGTAVAPGTALPILISARSGNDAVDRRGIGELRVGVEAKGAALGMLFAPADLGAEALREWERPGRSIAVCCGDALVEACVAAGIGVQSLPTVVQYCDESFLDELLTD